MATPRSRHARYSIASCGFALSALALSHWLDGTPATRRIASSLAQHCGSTVVLALLLAIPVIPVSCALVALTCSALTLTKRWHRGHVAWLSVLLLAEGVALHLLGDWLAGLYGMDPPEAYYWIGSAMMLTSLTTPLVILVLIGRALWRRSRTNELHAP